MTWEVRAICDGCGSMSRVDANKSALAGELRRQGWEKGGKSGRVFCPMCGQKAEEERKRRRHG